MKHRITATVDEETVLKLREFLRSSRSVRNKSHIVEVALQEFLEREGK